jgi:hypothetical protein
MFLPLGVLIHRELGRRRLGWGPLWAGGAILAFALAIQLLQALVAGRHARLSDLMPIFDSGFC